jgi:hypothetical protein
MARDPRGKAHQRRQSVAGIPRTSNLGGANGNPVSIVIESGSPQFLTALAKSMGLDNSSQSGSSSPMATMSAIISGQKAITQATKQMVGDMRVATDMIRQNSIDQAQWAGQMQTMRQAEAAHMASLVSMLSGVSANLGTATTAASTAASSAAAAAASAAQAAATAVVAVQAGQGTTTPVGPPGGGGGGGSGPPPITPPPVPGHGGSSSYVGSGHTTLGSLRSRVANFANNQVGTGVNTPDLMENRDAQGNITGYRYRTSSQAPWQTIAATSRRIPGLRQAAMRRATIGNVASGYSQAGIGGAARAVPYLGTAIAIGEATNKAAIWGTEQRAANANYQAIYGGENFDFGEAIGSGMGMLGGGPDENRSGMASRLQEQGFVLGQRLGLGMTEEQARQSFQGVSALGYSGAKRGKSLDFISDNYKQMGMSVQESLELVQVSAQHANASLGGVAKGLKTVTEAAVATGQSAAALRQSYIGNYGASLAAGAGAGAGGLATAFTMAGAGVSRDLAGLNYSGVLQNPGMMNLLAGQSGRTAGQLLSEVNSGNIRALTQPLQQRLDQSMTGTMSQSVRDDLKSLVTKAGGNQAVGQSQGAQRSIALQLMKNRGWNIYTARTALANVVGDTSGMDDVQVAEAFVANLSGAGPDAQAQTVDKGNQITALGGDELKNAMSGLGSNFATDYRKKTLDYQDQNVGIGDAISEIWGTSREKNTSRAMQTNLDAYIGYQKDTKSSNPAIEALITRLGDNTDARIQVQTKQGPRVVTIDEAIKYYSDQISSGQAIVMNAGDESGKTVAESTGVRVGGFTPGAGGTKDSTTMDAPAGQSIDDWRKANPGQSSISGNSSGTVTISPSPELRRLFAFTGTGGVNIDGAAAAGRPPVPGVGPR